jgi:hypothetical protein
MEGQRKRGGGNDGGGGGNDGGREARGLEKRSPVVWHAKLPIPDVTRHTVPAL